jgi:peptidoglycan hydrolase-like protein with peptidoglycan-binding domain
MIKRVIGVVMLVAAFVSFGSAASARSLSPGSSGRQVAALQGYLAADGYLPWDAVDGSYDYRTLQAVMAFEGWSGITRDGVASDPVLRRLKRAKPPVPWSRYHGKRVEVHISQQVVLLVDANNHLVRAIHVSTGASGKTPFGDYVIFRKEVLSPDPLFNTVLPWASYFYSGYALHQYPDVPGYPASHGCVRLPAPEAHVVYAFAGFGTAVHIHA